MEIECRAIIKVIGQVQGVGYRYSTLQMALNLKLRGFVKNVNSDCVYIEVQGNPDSVMALIEWCRTGPPRAIIDSVEYSFHPVSDFSKFQVR